MATALKELIPPPSSGNGEGVSARPLREDGQVTTTTTTMDPEDLNLQTFLNMPEDEYEHALEKATERKGLLGASFSIKFFFKGVDFDLDGKL